MRYLLLGEIIFLFQALAHSYFFTHPFPCPLTDMPKPKDGHRNTFRGMVYYDM